MKSWVWFLLFVLCTIGTSGCASPGQTQAGSTAPAPAKVRNGGVKEADLATIALTEQAEQRLGIETSKVVFGSIPRQRTFAGEVVLPPGSYRTVACPVAGTMVMERELPPPGSPVRRGQALVRILPMVAAQRDLRVTAEAELATARSQLETDKLAAARAEQMLRDQVGSARALEQAQNQLKLSQAAFASAQAKLDQIDRAPLDADVSLTISVPENGLLRQWFAAPGQKVAVGAPLFEIADLATVWIKVPVYAGEVRELDTRASARIEHLGAAAGPARNASPVTALPTADALAATVDLYYQLNNESGAYHPGERLNVTLPLRGGEESLHVPRAAILYDYLGGAWVYEKIPPHTYVRRRVEVRRTQGDVAVLVRGLKQGAEVVTAGAAELFGTEFGAGK